jgi:hypothetical protein
VVSDDSSDGLSVGGRSGTTAVNVVGDLGDLLGHSIGDERPRERKKENINERERLLKCCSLNVDMMGSILTQTKSSYRSQLRRLRRIQLPPGLSREEEKTENEINPLYLQSQGSPKNHPTEK